MNKKLLLLLTIPLIQTVPVWSMDNPTDCGNAEDRFFRQPRRTRAQHEQDVKDHEQNVRDHHFVLAVDEELLGNGELAQFHYEEAFRSDASNYDLSEEKDFHTQQAPQITRNNQKAPEQVRSDGEQRDTPMSRPTVWHHISSDGIRGVDGNPGLGGPGGVHGRYCQGTLETGRTEQHFYERVNMVNKVEEYDIPRLVSREKQVVRELSTMEFFQNLWAGPSMPLNSLVLMHITNLPSDFLKWTEVETIQELGVEKAYRTVQEPVIEKICGRSVSLPDLWHVPHGHQASRGYANHGNSGVGLNITGQQNPAPQSVLNQDDSLSHYKAYYLQEIMTANIAGFVKPFPNL